MSQAAGVTLSLARLLDPAVAADPYPLYRQLREQAPVHFDPYLKVWLVSDHRTAVDVLQRLSAQRAPTEQTLDELGLGRLAPIARLMARQMLFLDPPEHTRVRAIAAAAFTARRVQRLRERVQAATDALLDEMPPGDVDLMPAFAHPLPAVVMADALGLPSADYPRLKRWSEKFADVLGSIQHNPAAAAGLLADLDDMTAYFRAAVRRQLEHPPAHGTADGLVHAMARAEVQSERLAEDEVVANLILTMVGGYETTSHLIGSGLLTLLRAPDMLERLHAEPALMPAAIEELLRLESPIQHTARIATEDMVLAGENVRAGQPVLVLLGATNRDPAVFADPDRIDLGRRDNRHLAFGWAGHFCFGAALARLEGEVALSTLLRRFPRIRLAGQPVQWRANPAFRGPASLAVIV